MESNFARFGKLVVLCGLFFMGAFWHGAAKADPCTYYMNSGASGDYDYSNCMSGSPSPGNPGTGGTGGGVGGGGVGGSGATNTSISSTNTCSSTRADRFQDAKNAVSNPSTGSTVIVYYSGGGWDKFEYSAPIAQPNSPDWFVSDTGCIGSIASRN